jgi:hypothetical protein
VRAASAARDLIAAVDRLCLTAAITVDDDDPALKDAAARVSARVAAARAAAP